MTVSKQEFDIIGATALMTMVETFKNVGPPKHIENSQQTFDIMVAAIVESAKSIVPTKENKDEG